MRVAKPSVDPGGIQTVSGTIQRRPDLSTLVADLVASIAPILGHINLLADFHQFRGGIRLHIQIGTRNVYALAGPGRKIRQCGRGLVEFLFGLPHCLHFFGISVIVDFNTLLVGFVAGFLLRFLSHPFRFLKFLIGCLLGRLKVFLSTFHIEL